MTGWSRKWLGLGGVGLLAWALILGILGVGACAGEHRRALPAGVGEAVVVEAKGCDDGDLFACNNLGAFYEGGQDVGQDLGKAMALYTLACEGGAALGCVNAGGMWREGRGTEVRPDRAMAFFERACLSGETGGCLHLGELLWGAPGVEPDQARAVAYFEQACMARLLLGCRRHAAAMVALDPARAGEAFGLWERTCEAGDMPSCTAAARMLLDPASPHANPTLGETRLANACYGEDGEACWLLSRRWLETGRPTLPDLSVEALTQRACQWGYPDACPH